MFANAVPVYEDNDLIGTDRTTSDDNFDPSHPLYGAIRDFSSCTSVMPRSAPALRSTGTAPTVPACTPSPDRSRRARRVRGRAQQQRDRRYRCRPPTFSPSGVRYQLVSGPPDPRQGVPEKLTTGADGVLSVHCPAARLRHLPVRRSGQRQRRRAGHHHHPASSTATRRCSRPTRGTATTSSTASRSRPSSMPTCWRSHLRRARGRR